MAVNLSPYGGVGAQFLDNAGNVLTGGKIFTYASGTTTPQVTYTSNSGTIPHSNPIILDAAGRVPGGEIWLTDGLVYKFILRDANDVLIATYDGISGINSNFVAFTNKQEIQTATAGQTVFNLTTMSYAPGTNGLSVFVDGVNQYGPGAQYAYLETDSDTVTFVNGLHVGAEVKFTTSQLNSSVSTTDAFQISYTPPYVGSAATNVGAKIAQIVSPQDFGAVGDGVADDTAAIQAAINTTSTYIPPGTYRVTQPIILPSNAKVYGAGINKTIINSEVIGDSLFKCSVDTIFIRIADMSLEGNGLTGASGNGHAINFVDPVSAGGTFSPQQAVLERLEINNFRGQDIRTTGVATTICAAGICMYNTLQNVCRDIYISNCGHGFYMATTQNCRIENSIAVNIDKYALVAYDNENLVVDKCDLLAAGDGIVDPGYPSTALGWGSGVVLSYENDCFVLKGSKLKNINAGSALVRSLLSVNDVYDSNWIRADTITNTTHKAFYIDRSYNTQIINNEFHPANDGFSATQKYQQIELYNNQTQSTMLTRIVGNTFGDVSGMDIEYNIKIVGASSLNTHQVIIEGNNFGFNTPRGAACVVDNDILIDTCTIISGRILNNLHIASTNVTRTSCVTGSSFVDNINTIGPSRFIANGGTLTSEYTNVEQSVLWGGVLYNPPSLPNGSRSSTTVTVTGASITYPSRQFITTVSFNKDLQGIELWGYVSSANTVTVVFLNNTGGTIDLASGAIYVKVEKYAPPSL